MKRIDLFRSSLSLFDWSGVLKGERVKFIVGEGVEGAGGKIEEYFPDNFLKGVEVFEHRPSIRLYPQYYSKIKDKLQTVMEERRRGIQKVTTTIREDYGRIGRPPDPELHPQT